jgi:hypothetical protein
MNPSWGNFFSGLGNLATSISTAVNPAPVAVAGAPGVLWNPQTGQLISTNSLGSIGSSPILLIGLVVLAFFLLKK